jgi:phage baseplate assembly protein W
MISFDNVGYKIYDTRKLVNPEVSQTPVGILTPLSIDENGDTFFTTTTDVAVQIEDNLKNLILTNHGERLGRYFFGANVKPLTVEYTSQADFDAEAMQRIKTAVRDYMPYVNLVGYSSKVQPRAYGSSISTIDVLIKFEVQKANITNGFIKLTLYVS